MEPHTHKQTPATTTKNIHNVKRMAKKVMNGKRTEKVKMSQYSTININTEFRRCRGTNDTIDTARA